MLLINLASDIITLQASVSPETILRIPYVDLERNLPKILHDAIKDSISKSVTVISGPGSFTTLRIGTMILAMLQEAYPKLVLYQTHKFDLYAYGVDHGYLPKTGLLYIGKKKKMRAVQRDRTYTSDGASFSRPIKGWKVDDLGSDQLKRILQENDQLFFDDCNHVIIDESKKGGDWRASFALSAHPTLSKDNAVDSEIFLSMRYAGNSFEIPLSEISRKLSTGERCKPEYFLEPTMG